MKRRVLALIALTTMMLGATLNVCAASSELTGEQIDDAIVDQRPIAVMVDNERIALDHYGVAEADIVYEMMNSTANGRITRLMCLYKDWKNIGQTGSIRSVRTTNIMVADEYNAVLVHDGGPFYIDSYFAQPYADHLSGGFSRVPNGKRREFTEYVFGNEVANRFASAGLSLTYNYAPERRNHFVFGGNDLAGGQAAGTVDLSGAFPHNGSKLLFNADTQTYDYYEYGRAHVDKEDGQIATFKNVILQNVSFTQLDPNGYLTYNIIGQGSGYYLTNGRMIPITWSKGSELGQTRYTDANGNEISVNVGKTYIGIIPSDGWGTVRIN